MAIDSCATAQDITSSLPFSDSYSNAAFSNSTGLPAGSGYELAFNTTLVKAGWYKITAAADMRLRIDTQGSSFDTIIQVYSGSCAGLTPVDANDDRSLNDDSAVLVVDLTGGNTYYIAVGSTFSSGTISVAISETPYPIFRQINPVTSQGGPLTINVPGLPKGPSSGDLVFVLIGHKEASYATPPAGFSVVQRDISGTVRAELYVKTATGSEGSTYVFTLPNTGNIAAVGFAFSVAGGTLDASGVRVNASGASGCASVTAIKEFNWVFLLGVGATTPGLQAFSAWATGSPGSLSLEEIEDTRTVNGTDVHIGFSAATMTPAGATGDGSWTASIGDNVGFLLVVGVEAGYTPPDYEPLEDVSDPCCGSGTGTGGGTNSSGSGTPGVTGDIPVVNPNAPYGQALPTECADTFVGETASDLTDTEDWRTLAGPTPNMLCELHAVKHPDTLGSTTYQWADQGLDFPAESAFVEGRVRRGGWSEIRRAMALPDQYPEVGRAGVTIDEQDALLRTLLDTDSTSYLVAREWVSWLISEVGRKSSTAMRCAFRGVVSGLNPGPGRTYTIEAEDQITSPFGVFNPDKLVPQILMTQAFFPPGTGLPGGGVDDAGLPTAGLHKDLEGKPFPILAGTQSDAGAVSADGQSAEKGAVPLIWVRDVNLPESPTQVWGEFLICLGETDSIPDIYASDTGRDPGGVIPTPARAPRRMLLEEVYGTDLLSPDDMPSWTYFTGLSTRYIERTEGGQTIRYSAIYLRGPRAEHHRLGLVTVSANVCPKAPQTVGPFLQWFLNEHVAKNQGQGYSSGDYGPLETYASDATVPYLQTSTFTDYQDYTIDRLGDAVGYVVRGFQLREQFPLREIEKRFMQDYEVSLPFNHHGQKMLRWIDDLADPTVGTPYRERIEIDEPLPPYRDAHDEVENLVNFQFDYDHDLQVWRREPETIQDDLSIEAHYGVFSGGRRLVDGQPPSPFEVYSTSDAATVRDAFQRRLLRKRKAPRYQEIPSDLAALHDEIGDQILLTHSRGVGASGYVARPFYVLEQRHNPNRHKVTLRTLDLKAITDGVGYWTDDSAPTWDSSSETERLEHGFWASDDGTIPSGNVPGKEWR